MHHPETSTRYNEFLLRPQREKSGGTKCIPLAVWWCPLWFTIRRHIIWDFRHISKSGKHPRQLAFYQTPQPQRGWPLSVLRPSGLYRFHEDVENMVQVLEAPLWGGRASVLLLLPFHVENLARLDKLLSLQLMSKWLEKSSVSSVSISLPQANISSALNLQVGLQSDDGPEH